MKSKDKENEKKIDYALIFLICIGVIAISILFFTSYKKIQVNNNECLVKIAKDFCEEKEMNYHNVFWSAGAKFKCIEERRTYDGLEGYYFTEEEMEECLK